MSKGAAGESVGQGLDFINPNKVFNINLISPKGHTLGEDFPFKVDIDKMRHKHATGIGSKYHSQTNLDQLSCFPSGQDFG